MEKQMKIKVALRFNSLMLNTERGMSQWTTFPSDGLQVSALP